MSHSAEPVSVIILEKKYQFACDPEQRSDLIEAARNLDECMSEIRDSGRLLSLERIALQAALNFSADLLKLQRQQSQREERIDSRIHLLANQIEDALKE
jgi:cell division protein ZapA